MRRVVEIARAASIGHNHPPEAIDPPPLTVEDVDSAISIANTYRSELSTIHQSNEHIIEGMAQSLGCFGKKLAAFPEWLRHRHRHYRRKARAILADIGQIVNILDPARRLWRLKI